MQVKRRLSRDDGDEDSDRYFARYRPSPDDGGKLRRSAVKRARASFTDAIAARPPSRDIISKLPSELLVRIFSFFSEATLLEISPVSQLFRRVSSDGQLWRWHYYRRFILPRAHLIPGFRKGTASKDSRLSYGSQKSVRADGSSSGSSGAVQRQRGGRVGTQDDPSTHPGSNVDWMKYYKLQHNWARGRCEVDELHFRAPEEVTSGKTLVKVVEGLAVTADSTSNLMVWDLRTRLPIAHASLDSYRGLDIQPTCIAVDDEKLADSELGIAIGFEDGTFGIWKIDLQGRTLTKLCRYKKSCFGELAAIAYHNPYLIVGSVAGFITLWTFERANPQWTESPDHDESPPTSPTAGAGKGPLPEKGHKKSDMSSGVLPPPYMLRSLKSHRTRLPLTLSIRRMSSFVVASIAYTLDTVGGWCITIQDLDILPRQGMLPEVSDSRVAYTAPAGTRGSPSSSPGSSPGHGGDRGYDRRCHDDKPDDDGPIRLCYSHPYLLATLPDNTLVLHMCTSTTTSLSISAGMRLWGHTSGISDAEITTRGKAVSVSAKGDEIRVWELEGRVGGSSVEVRPRQQDDTSYGGESSGMGGMLFGSPELGYRKNKVGFDDEMVIVLKEDMQGRESLMVYDFT